MIGPGEAFGLGVSIEVIVMIMLGGRATFTSALLGAAFYGQLRGYLLILAAAFEFLPGDCGGLLLVVVLFAPDGFMGWISRFAPGSPRLFE